VVYGHLTVKTGSCVHPQAKKRLDQAQLSCHSLTRNIRQSAPTPELPWDWQLQAIARLRHPAAVLLLYSLLLEGWALS